MKNLKLKWKLLISYGTIFLLLLVLGISSISVSNMMSKYDVEKEYRVCRKNSTSGRGNRIGQKKYDLGTTVFA